MRLFVRFIIFGAFGCIVLTFNQFQKESMHVDFPLNPSDEIHVEQIEEFSGDNLLEVEPGGVKRTKDIQSVKMKLKVLSSTKNHLTIEFDAKFPWNKNFSIENSPEAENLKKAFRKYFYDLLKRRGNDRMTVKVSDSMFSPTDSQQFTHFTIFAECEIGTKYHVQSAAECQAIAKFIAEKIGAKELSLYFHEQAYSEQVHPDLLRRVYEDDNDFFFEDPIEKAVTVLPPGYGSTDYNALAETVHKTKLIHTADDDDYHEENYDIIHSEEIDDSFENNSELLINYVERLSEDEFQAEAFLPTLLNEEYENTPEYSEKFKNYMERTYELNSLFNGSKIIVELINKTNSIEFDNENLIWFSLTTFNISINDDELILDNRTTIFDYIFKNFRISDFEDQFETEDSSEVENSTEVEVFISYTSEITTTITDYTTENGLPPAPDDDDELVDNDSSETVEATHPPYECEPPTRQKEMFSQVASNQSRNHENFLSTIGKELVVVLILFNLRILNFVNL